MAAQEERTLRLLVEVYDTRILQLQRQVDGLGRAGIELSAGEEELKKIEDELERAINKLTTTIKELDGKITDLEQEALEKLKIQRDQLVRDETRLQNLKATFLNQTEAFAVQQTMLAQYRERVDQFVTNTKNGNLCLLNHVREFLKA